MVTWQALNPFIGFVSSWDLFRYMYLFVISINIKFELSETWTTLFLYFFIAIVVIIFFPSWGGYLFGSSSRS